jgi:hypothetical protein
VLLAVLWAGFGLSDAETGRAGIFALTVGLVIMLLAAYHSQPGRGLILTDYRVVAQLALVGVALSGIWLATYARVTGANLFAAAQWRELLFGSGRESFALIMTAMTIAAGVVAGAAARVFVWRILG